MPTPLPSPSLSTFEHQSRGTSDGAYGTSTWKPMNKAHGTFSTKRRKYSSSGRVASGIGAALMNWASLTGMTAGRFLPCPLGLSHGNRKRLPAGYEPWLPRTKLMLTTPARPTASELRRKVRKLRLDAQSTLSQVGWKPGRCPVTNWVAAACRAGGIAVAQRPTTEAPSKVRLLYSTIVRHPCPIKNRAKFIMHERDLGSKLWSHRSSAPPMACGPEFRKLKLMPR